MQFKLLSLRIAIALKDSLAVSKLAVGIALTTTLAILAPTMASAADDDKSIDMSNLTCGEFQDLGKREKVMSLIWLSGWMAQEQGDFILTPDREAMSDRKDALEAACENNEGDLLINQLIPRLGKN